MAYRSASLSPALSGSTLTSRSSSCSVQHQPTPCLQVSSWLDTGLDCRNSPQPWASALYTGRSILKTSVWQGFLEKPYNPYQELEMYSCTIPTALHGCCQALPACKRLLLAKL